MLKYKYISVDFISILITSLFFCCLLFLFEITLICIKNYDAFCFEKLFVHIILFWSTFLQFLLFSLQFQCLFMPSKTVVVFLKVFKHKEIIYLCFIVIFHPKVIITASLCIRYMKVSATAKFIRRHEFLSDVFVVFQMVWLMCIHIFIFRYAAIFSVEEIFKYVGLIKCWIACVYVSCETLNSLITIFKQQ